MRRTMTMRMMIAKTPTLILRVIPKLTVIFDDRKPHYNTFLLLINPHFP